MCTSVISGKAYIVSFIQCVKVMRLSCLVDQHKQSSAGPMKNNLDWLHCFMQCFNLHFTCSSCRYFAGIRGISNNIVTATGENDLSLLISSINNQFATIRQSLNSVTAVTTSLSSSKQLSSSTEALTSLCESTLASYTNVLNKNVTDTIKSAISENIKCHKIANTNGSMFVVYGFPEEGNGSMICFNVKGTMETSFVKNVLSK